MKLAFDDPQNPYASFMVQASAGSGKTYQLTQRFLNLVEAGAAPESILTITFTVKAAKEMKERILKEAQVRLARGGREILAASSKLQILTIDALFSQWVHRFPTETVVAQGLSFPFRVGEVFEIRKQGEKAWEELFRQPETQGAIKDLIPLFLELNPTQGVLGAKGKLEELLKHESFLWQLSQEGESSGFVPHPTGPERHGGPRTLEEVCGHVEQELLQIAAQAARFDTYGPMIFAKDWEGLIRERLLTKELTISGSTIRGKKREALSEVIGTVESAFRQVDNRRKAERLNLLGRGLFQVYQLWQQSRRNLKRSASLAEFSDLAFGAYRLFHQDSSAGAQWLISKQVRHLLLDEFQDTSPLQWSVFRTLMAEILSGQSGGTVFIVGDAKQSIYGFREADPRVLGEAQSFLESFGARSVPLNASYRSAPLILDFVNQVFSQQPPLIPDFPEHSTAQSVDGVPVMPNVGMIMVHKGFEDPEDPLAKEAQFVAETAAQWLRAPEKLPVWDKDAKSFRPLKPSDIAILYRDTTHVEVFEERLTEAKLSFVREEKKGFFGLAIVKDLLHLMGFLATPSSLLDLGSVIRSPFLNIPDQIWLSWLEESKALAPADRVSWVLRATESSWLFGLLELAQVLSPRELVRKILRHPCFEDPRALANGEKLFFLVSRAEDQGALSLIECVYKLNEYAKEDTEGPAFLSGDQIKLMTIHKSKGLEFPVVFLVETGQPWFRQDRYWLKQDRLGLSYLGTFAEQPVSDPHFRGLRARQNADLYAESSRLLYVALTRASQVLVITGNGANGADPEGAFLPKLYRAAQALARGPQQEDVCILT